MYQILPYNLFTFFEAKIPIVPIPQYKSNNISFPIKESEFSEMFLIMRCFFTNLPTVNSNIVVITIFSIIFFQLKFLIVGYLNMLIL